MRKIYTGIDIGSYSIKIIVSEYINGKFQVLAATNVKSKGIRNGLIVDIEQASLSLQKAKQEIETAINIKLNQAIVTVPSDGIKFDVVTGNINFEKETLIGPNEITKSLQEAVIGHIEDDFELVTILPISFQVDDNEPVKDPKGLLGSKMEIKAVISKIPKYLLEQTVKLFKQNEIEVIDFGFSSLADYYEARNKEMDKEVVSIVNIGYDSTEVSIFNKGIMIKDEKIDIGSREIDADLMNRFSIKKSAARHLKEEFAVSNTRYADSSDTVDIKNKFDEVVTLNQLQVSEIIENRLVEILKLAKKQISILTNREISYIILTGGISELTGFQYVVENVFDGSATTLNIGTIGIRSNVYSSTLGLIKYFHNKLELRGNTYSMLNEKEAENLTTKERDSASDGLLSKVFGYFTSD